MLVVTWGNGLYMSLRVAERLAADGIGCRVLDLRWLAPLPIEEVARHAARSAGSSSSTRRGARAASARRSSAGSSSRVSTSRSSRVAGQDSFIPLADAANLVLVSEDDIEAAIRSSFRCRAGGSKDSR